MNNLELVDQLCAVSAVLREARRAHIHNFGTLIPHVFMGDVLARVGACVLAARHGALLADCAELQDILGVLEQGLAGGDRETRNVIAVSFVGDSELEVFFQELRPMLGPRIRAQLQGK